MISDQSGEQSQQQYDDSNESSYPSLAHNVDTPDSEPVSKSINTFNFTTTITNVNSNSVASQAAQAISALGSSGPGHSKSYFDLKLKLVSTLHTQDVYLERFISLSNSRSNTTDPTHDLALRQALNDLCYVESETLVKFLNVILDKIFFLMINANTSALAQSCIEVTAKIVNKITNLLSNQNDIHKRNRLLIQYAKYSCNLPTNKHARLFHEHFLTEWLNCLTRKTSSSSTLPLSPVSNGNHLARDLLLKNSWFFFEILLKSLAVYLNLKTSCLKPSSSGKKCLPPNNLSLNLFFTKQLNQKFIFDLNTLVKSTVFEIANQLTTNEANASPHLANGLNCSLAFFLYDLTSILDRGYLFKQVDFYFRETNRGLTQLSNQIKNVTTQKTYLFNYSLLNSLF